MTSAAIKSELQHDLFFQRWLLFKHCGERSHLARDEYYGKLSVELTEHINVLHQRHVHVYRRGAFHQFLPGCRDERLVSQLSVLYLASCDPRAVYLSRFKHVAQQSRHHTAGSRISADIPVSGIAHSRAYMFAHVELRTVEIKQLDLFRLGVDLVYLLADEADIVTAALQHGREVLLYFLAYILALGNEPHELCFQGVKLQRGKIHRVLAKPEHIEHFLILVAPADEQHRSAFFQSAYHCMKSGSYQYFAACQ